MTTTTTAPRLPSVVILWDHFAADKRAALVDLVNRLQRETSGAECRVAVRFSRPAGVSIELFVSRVALTLQAGARIDALAEEVGAVAVDIGRLETLDRLHFLGSYGRRHGPAILVNRDARAAVEELLGPGGEEEPAPGHARRVLIADDSAFFRATLSEALSELGCEVIVAKDGADAMGRLTEELLSLDLFVLDVEMPGLDGRAVLDRVRRLGGERDLPVAIVTGSPSRRDELLRLGADDVLSKGGPVGSIARRLLAVARAPGEARLAG